MDQKTASKLLSENLTAIYGFAFARLYDKDMVDDLCSEIVCEVMGSVGKLQNDSAFWGFVWRIAENTFRKFIKRRGEDRNSDNSDSLAEISAPSTEDEFIESEEKKQSIFLLRRELSLLSKLHREISVAYYIENKSCSEIAKEKSVSVETVKYHLFKTRKLLKEGIGMTRKLGEKSYNPGTFRLDFWGDWNKYGNTFDRKLPGNIVLSAYYLPMTAEEISMELGVSMPYLEEELEILEKAGVLKKIGNKYQSNLVIITDDYEKEFVNSTRAIYSEVSGKVFEKSSELLSTVRSLDFSGNNYDDNRLLFMMINIAVVNAFISAKGRSPLGEAKKLALGGNGWIFGYDNDYSNHHFYGVSLRTDNNDNTAWFSAENYRVISKCQLWSHERFTDKCVLMWDAILNKPINKENNVTVWLAENGFIQINDGIAEALFPVFSNKAYEEICEIIKPVRDIIADCMIDISARAENILKEHVPSSVKDQCGDIAKIHHRLDVGAFIMEELISANKLTLPEEKVPLCVWGVRM
ncbi:MAG: sigma-70 family RNA polymerase sigma factor [Clostridia bacterium]|nr:sigma-70 family RNA polymerase sigma factor [Clostridia bacterium]